MISSKAIFAIIFIINTMYSKFTIKADSKNDPTIIIFGQTANPSNINTISPNSRSAGNNVYSSLYNGFSMLRLGDSKDKKDGPKIIFVGGNSATGGSSSSGRINNLQRTNNLHGYNSPYTYHHLPFNYIPYIMAGSHLGYGIPSYHEYPWFSW